MRKVGRKVDNFLMLLVSGFLFFVLVGVWKKTLVGWQFSTASCWFEALVYVGRLHSRTTNFVTLQLDGYKSDGEGTGVSQGIKVGRLFGL